MKTGQNDKPISEQKKIRVLDRVSVEKIQALNESYAMETVQWPICN